MGGLAFNSDRVTKEEISEIITVLNFRCDMKYNESHYLGSTGKAESSGDIDLYSIYPLEDVHQSLTAYMTAVDDIEYFKNLGVLSACIKYKDKRVQIDFIEGPYSWIKFSFFSPGPNSKYKGLYRTELLKAIVSSFGSSITDEQGELIAKVGPIFYRHLGIQICHRMRPLRKDGIGRIKTVSNVSAQEFENNFPNLHFKTDQQFPIIDPSIALKFMFGFDVNTNDVETFEQIFDLIQKYKTVEEQKLIFKIYGMILKHLKRETPEEVKCLEQTLK